MHAFTINPFLPATCTVHLLVSLDTTQHNDWNEMKYGMDGRIGTFALLLSYAQRRFVHPINSDAVCRRRRLLILSLSRNRCAFRSGKCVTRSTTALTPPTNTHAVHTQLIHPLVTPISIFLMKHILY